MAWCLHATSHHLSQCWHRAMSPEGITSPQMTSQTCCRAVSWSPGRVCLCSCRWSHGLSTVHHRRSASLGSACWTRASFLMDPTGIRNRKWKWNWIQKSLLLGNAIRHCRSLSTLVEGMSRHFFGDKPLLKWPTFYRQHFKMHFPGRNFNSNFTEVCS